MKKLRFTWVTIIMSTVFVGAVLYAATSAFATTTKKPVDSQLSTDQNPITLSTSPASGSDPNKTSYVTKQQVNGIEIEVVGKQVIENFLLANICFQLPDDKDWLLGNRPEDIVLTVGDKTISHSGWSAIDLKTDAKGVNIRCDQVKFSLSGQEDLSSFVITVNHLITSIPEVPDCDKAQAKLDKKETGIKIKCSKTESSFSYEITQKPESLSDYEVQRSIGIAFSETVDGPWVFTDSIDNQ